MTGVRGSRDRRSPCLRMVPSPARWPLRVVAVGLLVSTATGGFIFAGGPGARGSRGALVAGRTPARPRAVGGAGLRGEEEGVHELRGWVLRNTSAAHCIVELVEGSALIVPRAPADVAASNSWGPAGTRAFDLGLPRPGRARLLISELNFEEGGLGSKIWESSFALACFAALNPSAISGRRVLEVPA